MDLYCLTRQLSLLNLSVLHFLLHQYFRLSLSAQLNRLSRLSRLSRSVLVCPMLLWNRLDRYDRLPL